MSGLSRRQLLFWLVFFLIVCVPVGALFLAKPLFLDRAGVEAGLLRRAAALRGMPPERAAGEVGRMAKAYLDATRHVSRAEVEVRAASAGRLAFTVFLPWSEVSGKQRRLRAEALGRLAGGMLRGAGAEGVAVEVEVRRWRKDSDRESDPAGRYLHDPRTGAGEWREAP
ncbi:MAG: hypothetical protein A3I72_06765 [Candidatus Tectomicrobia bacterium RIFCSPLOWO2_02_FULL_70_19]|nr:MAG: hypothetical protein A3I72_06765 [Candidatus Tectomicrobia bacterium RIFCSPLOWO2_02_FULL_70_19]